MRRKGASSLIFKFQSNGSQALKKNIPGWQRLIQLLYVLYVYKTFKCVDRERTHKYSLLINTIVIILCIIYLLYYYINYTLINTISQGNSLREEKGKKISFPFDNRENSILFLFTLT